MPEPSAFERLLARAREDPDVVGVVLSGSQARQGMATGHSDFDVYVVTADRTGPGADWATVRAADLDQSVMTLEAFRVHALPGSSEEWNRYSFAHARVLLDRLGGEIARLTLAKGTLEAGEADRLARSLLGAYLNSVYRSAKSHRDGRPLEARLDAAESLPFLLGAIFAMHRRVRPYNQYLRWELEHHPLPEPEWRAGRLLDAIDRILATGDLHAQRQLFRDATRIARAHGLGAAIDEWGDDLDLIEQG